MANGHQPALPASHMTDPELLHRVAEGDVDAFEALYLRHWYALLTYLIGQLDKHAIAEEVLQDVMLAVWHGSARFRGDASVLTWMFAIARHHAFKAREHHSQTDVPILEDQIAESQDSPAEAFERRERRTAIHEALHQLSIEQREIIELVFYHGLTGPEVASVTGVALGTVKSRLRRAKRHLSRLLRLQEAIDV